MAETAPGFQLLLENLQEVGFFRSFLPLLLFIAIYYGLLNKSQAISDEDRVNGVAAVSLAFLTQLGLYSFLPFTFVQQFFVALSIILVVLLGVTMIMGMFGVEFSAGEIEYKSMRYVILGVIVLLLVGGPLLLMQAGFSVPDRYWEIITTIAMLAVMGWIVYSMGRGS